MDDEVIQLPESGKASAIDKDEQLQTLKARISDMDRFFTIVMAGVLELKLALELHNKIDNLSISMA